MEQDSGGDYLPDYFEWDDGGQQQQYMYDASVAAPQDHNQQQSQQYAAAVQPDAAGMPAGCILSSDLRPTDILCGRGNYSNPGNATFVLVCESHRAEYTSCKSFREKQVVADQIYDELCRAGSGRFLQLVKGPNRKKDRTNNKGGSGGGGGGSVTTEEEKTSYWKEMDRKDIGVKIKQGLRQKRAPPKRGRRQQAGGEIVAAEGGGSPAAAQQGGIAVSDQHHHPIAPLSSSAAEGASEAGAAGHEFDEVQLQQFQEYQARLQSHIPQQDLLFEHHQAHDHIIDPGDSSAAAAAALLEGGIDDVDVDLLEMLATATDLNEVDHENANDIGNAGAIDAAAIEPVPIPLPAPKMYSSSQTQKVPPHAVVGADVITQRPSPEAAMSSETGTNKRGCLPADENGSSGAAGTEQLVTSSAAPSADGQLRFPDGKLYGREKHIDDLRSSFGKVIPNGRGLVLVSGYPGSGKSELVEQIRSNLNTQKAMLIWTKFDVRGRMQARSPLIFKAFDEYCKQLLQGDPAVLDEVRTNVKKALGADAFVLTDLIPSLGDVLGDDIDDAKAEDHHDEGLKEMQRIVYHVRDFVRAIASTSHPVCMVFDDMQWANEQCLEMVSKLVTDTMSSSILFVGTYRDNDSKSDLAPLQECLGEIAMVAVPISNIFLENLSAANVNELVSATLGLPPQDTLSLSNALHTKTRGNPMFVKQLMRALVDERLLSYSANARRWQWNLQAIQLKAIADNAVDLLVDKMMKSYGAKNRDILRMASCLGSSFDETTMIMLCSQYAGSNQKDLLKQLGEMTADGMLIQSGPTYMFSHDQIWQACYELTPVEEREEMHLKLGRQIFEQIPPTHVDAFVFTIADQMNRGAQKLTDHNEELVVAELNLKAGEKAMANSSFLQASIYLAQGTMLIRDEDWTTHYNLCLRLFTICAESQLAHANYDGAILAINHVLSNGQSVEDKLRAYHACAIAFIAQAKMEKALDISMSVLNDLGEFFMADPTESEARNAFFTTKTLIEATDETIIGEMETATNPTKVEAMRFLLLASKSSYFVSPFLYALLGFRMVQITLLSGITPESAYGFTSFSSFCGVFLEHRPLDLERKCATTSMELIKRFDKFAPVIVAMLNHCLFAYTQPIQACLEQIKHSYELGMRGGDADWALSILPRVSKVGLFCGKSLDELESEMRINIRELKTYKHYMLQVNLLLFETVLNLRGPATNDSSEDDPTMLNGEGMDQSTLLAEFSDRPMHRVIRLFYYCRMYLAYLFRQYDTAAELVASYRSLAKDLFFLSKMDTIYDTYETFYRGLIAFAVLRQGDYVEEEAQQKWRDIATASMDQMKTGSEEGSEWNFRNKYELLSAEDAALRGDSENASEAYEAAIAKAEEYNFINEQALACERYGLYLYEIGSDSEGKDKLEKALSLYGSWGAGRKVQDVMALLQEKEGGSNI